MYQEIEYLISGTNVWNINLEQIIEKSKKFIAWYSKWERNVNKNGVNLNNRWSPRTI